MKIEIEIPDDIIESIVHSMPSGIAYWGRITFHTNDLLNFTVEDCEDNGKYSCSEAQLKKGLEILAEKYPYHIADIISEKYDMITSDALLQCSIFGEIKYG